MNLLKSIGAKFGYRKYYRRRRLIIEQWLFASVERQSHNLFVVSVPNRTLVTLILLIHRYIAPGNIIHNDFWRAYVFCVKRIFIKLSIILIILLILLMEFTLKITIVV